MAGDRHLRREYGGQRRRRQTRAGRKTGKRTRRFGTSPRRRWRGRGRRIRSGDGENISGVRAAGVEEDDRVVDLGALRFHLVDEDEEEAKEELVVALACCTVYWNGGAT
jgi:hypothetical protein